MLILCQIGWEKLKIPQYSAQNTDRKTVNVTVTDFGGQTEYLLSCKMFFNNNGLYVINIMFEAAKISSDNYITNIEPCFPDQQLYGVSVR